MAKLEVSSELLYLFRGSLHKLITDKDRAIRDARHYAENERQREIADPSRQSSLTSAQLFKVAESMQEALDGLQELNSIVEAALAADASAEAEVQAA